MLPQGSSQGSKATSNSGKRQKKRQQMEALQVEGLANSLEGAAMQPRFQAGIWRGYMERERARGLVAGFLSYARRANDQRLRSASNMS